MQELDSTESLGNSPVHYPFRLCRSPWYFNISSIADKTCVKGEHANLFSARIMLTDLKRNGKKRNWKTKEKDEGGESRGRDKGGEHGAWMGDILRETWSTRPRTLGSWISKWVD